MAWPAYLDEADIGSLLAKALAADIHAVLADQAMGVTAHTAAMHKGEHRDAGKARGGSSAGSGEALMMKLFHACNPSSRARC